MKRPCKQQKVCEYLGLKWIGNGDTSSAATRRRRLNWKTSFSGKASDEILMPGWPTEVSWLLLLFIFPFQVSGSVDTPFQFSTLRKSFSTSKNARPWGFVETYWHLVHLANNITVLQYNVL